MNEQAQVDIDLDLWEMEQQWKKSLPKLEEAQWLNIFPEAKKKYGSYIKKCLKGRT